MSKSIIPHGLQMRVNNPIIVPQTSGHPSFVRQANSFVSVQTLQSLVFSLGIHLSKFLPLRDKRLSLLLQKAYRASNEVMFSGVAIIVLLLRYVKKFFVKLKAITLLMLETKVAKVIIQRVREVMQLESV